ncbi:MAG: DNA-binding response regulator [Halobacteriovoraceae bacterium]|nr:DNA-binding response regulator [Halobacteriovoraceae bacterium]|tara:strand:+ start:15163 stop:15855 length:693 start_codon:yes stop_codon:yes gene_type:complete
MSNQKILIVEDEKNLGLTLKDYLETQNFEVNLAENVTQALSLFDSTTAIVLMDINLPDGNGIELAQALREKRKDFLLLFLSAQNDPETKYQGLEMGAQDFITKPFDLRELTIRLKKALQTHALLNQHINEIHLGKLSIRFGQFELEDANGKIINMGQKECGILELLYQKKNQVVSRDEILAQIWGDDVYPTNRTVDNYIVKLRKWIETDPTSRVSINTIRGVGYQLEIKE